MPEFPDVPDLSGDPDAAPRDPLAPDGGIAGAIDKAGVAAIEAVGDIKNPGIDPSVLENAGLEANAAIDKALSSVPTTADGVAGKQIQASVSAEIRAEPKALHDTAILKALDSASGDASRITSDELAKAYQDTMDEKVKAATDQLKADYKDATAKALGPDSGLDPKTDYKGKGSVIDQMVDDPAGTEASLEADGKAIEAENPGWKDRLKDVGKKLLGYGGKALLILALIGALIPGGGNVVEKLASMAGDVVSKIVTVAVNILKAFFGPLLTAFWNLIKSLKVPLMVIGGILLLVILVWLYRSLIGRS